MEQTVTVPVYVPVFALPRPAGRGASCWASVILAVGSLERYTTKTSFRAFARQTTVHYSALSQLDDQNPLLCVVKHPVAKGAPADGDGDRVLGVLLFKVSPPFG